MSRVHQIAFKIAGRMASSFNTAFSSTADRMRQIQQQTSNLQGELRSLESAQAKVARSRALESQIADTGKKFDAARVKVNALAAEMLRTEKPSQELKQRFKEASTQAENFKNKLAAQKRELTSIKLSLSNAGVNVKNLASDYSILTSKLNSTEGAMKRLGAAQKAVELRNRAMGALGNVGSALASPYALIGGGASLYGLGNLTIGQAMEFEQQQISMEHWLQGNKELAKEYTDWLDSFAARTPFEMGDVFPAGARAVNVADGDIKNAERLMTIAGDMAALTPGKTMEQAMEALADVKVGEYARLQEFGFKWKKELGGYEDFLKQAEKKFAGGAAKLSKTSKGQISTITDTIKTQFRAAGQGILVAMDPRLQKITDWFNENPATVAAWRNNIMNMAQEAFEGLLASGETFLGRLMAKFEDPGFQRLGWGGKLVAMISEASRIAVPAAASAGAQLGVEFGQGIAKGIWGAAAKDPLVALAVGFWVGGKVPGPIPVKIAAGVAVASAPAVVEGTKGYISDRKEAAKQSGVEGAVDWLNKNYRPGGAPVVPGGTMSAYASGGFANRPSVFGEAGLEAAIPIDGSSRSQNIWERAGELNGFINPQGSSRSQNIWERAGELLGIKGGGDTYNITYAPNINASGGNEAAIQRVLKSDKEDFGRWYKSMKHEQRRVSYRY
ncbi:MAG: Chromosome partition protein Smc [Pelotomaculum sp. PtaB.Bin104]|nr:MAG: Chromosome partition protein Smc [Pelotomaculum sp. PtaB.Bin104]